MSRACRRSLEWIPIVKSRGIMYILYYISAKNSLTVMGIKRFDHKTKVKVRSKRQNLQTASQLCTKKVGTGEMIKYKRELKNKGE